MEKIFYGVDIGGSLTKNFMIYGDKEYDSESNNYLIKHDGYINTVDFIADEEDYSTKLDLTIKINSKPEGKYRIPCVKIIDEINNNRWLMGTLANSVTTNATKLPLGMKVKQPHYYLNIIGSLIKDMEHKGVKEANVTLGVLLPAKQYFNLEKEMVGQILEGEIQVLNNITGDRYKIIIDDEIVIKAEAVVAFIASFIKDGKITELGQDLIKKFNIAIDVGENTTDIAGMRDGKPDPLTFDSFDYAGGLLLQYLEREISRDFDGYVPTLQALKSIISTGYINLGASKVWAGESISSANKEFATKLANDFTQKYLLNKGIKLQEIAAFMFLGGGCIEIDKITSVGEHFMNIIKEQSKYTISFSPEDIRLANINGLSDILRALYKEHKKKIKEENKEINAKSE